MLRFLANILVTGWLAFLTAAAFESHRPADFSKVTGLDTPPKASGPDLLDRIEQSVWNRNTPLVVTEAEANRYLANAIHGRQVGASRRLAEFDRIALSFHGEENGSPAFCRVWLLWKSNNDEKRTASLDFTLRREKQQYVIEPQRGMLGRLPVFRGALATLVPGLDNLCSALDEEIHAIFQMNQIRFEKGRVLLDPRFEGIK